MRKRFEILDNFRIKVEEKEVLRALGHTTPKLIHPEKDKKIKKIVEETLKLSSELIKPRGIYTIIGSREILNECFFDSAEKVAFSVCTIGEGLEKKVGSLSHKNELTKAVILDAIGSVVAEATAEHLNQVIIGKAKEKNLYCSTRFSPGYGGWRLEGQRLVFALLPAEKIGVYLNKSCMMIPRKSVSFAVNLSGNRFKSQRLTPCEICGLKDCRFRNMK